MKFATAFLLTGMLAGCAVAPPDDTVSFRPGVGVVQDVRPARVALPRAGTGTNGSTQRVTQDSAAFKAGELVQVVTDGRIVKTTGAADAAAPAPPAVRSYRPGIGIVESASVVSLPSSMSAAAGGASGPTLAYRLKMLDGTTQNVVQTGRRFKVGDRVQLTREGRLVLP